MGMNDKQNTVPRPGCDLSDSLILIGHSMEDIRECRTQPAKHAVEKLAAYMGLNPWAFGGDTG